MLIFITGCEIQKDFPDSVNGDSAVARATSADITFKVLDVYVDLDEDQCAGKCPGSEYPRDKANLLVEDIEMTFGKQETLNLFVGDEILVDLQYSSRPAKLLRDSFLDEVKGVSGDDIAVYYDAYPSRPIPIENDYFIYYLPIKKENEIVLPGLTVGDRILVENYGRLKKVGKYEIL